MYLIVETIEIKGKKHFVCPSDEQGYILSFGTEEQAVDYIEDLKEENPETINYQTVKVN